MRNSKLVRYFYLEKKIKKKKAASSRIGKHRNLGFSPSEWRETINGYRNN